MSLPSPKTCIYKNGDLCIVRVQAELRGFLDKEDASSEDKCKCVFHPPVSNITQRAGCPYFTGLITPQGIGDYELVGERRKIKGAKLPKDSDLLILSKKYDAPLILFCFLQGFIHPSYCVHCTSYLGKTGIGNAKKRLSKGVPSCRISTRSIGSICDDWLTFEPQFHIDGVMIEQSYSQTYEQNYFPMPLPEKLIKHEKRRDITLYDRFYYSYAFCFRCGPEKTKKIHFHCKKCGTRRLCNNCILDYKEETGELGDVAAHFTCPDCQHHNEINLGIDKAAASEYSHALSDAPHEQPDKPLWPADYQVLADRLGNWSGIGEKFSARTFFDNIVPDAIISEFALHNYEWPFHPLPSAEAVPVAIEDGLLKGFYFIDHKKKQAWRLRGKPEWRTDIIRRSPNNQNDFKYDFDAIISFKSEEIELANAIAHKLLEHGYYVYILQSAQNINDGLWDMRYSTALFRAKIFIPLFTRSFMKGEFKKFTINEMIEAQYLEQARNQLLDTDHAYIFPLISTNYTASEETEKCLSGRELLFQKEGIGVVVEKLINAINHAPKESLLSYKQKTDFIIEQDISIQLLDETCLQCGKPVVYDPNAKMSYEERDGRGIAFVCHDGHRFCTNCHSKEQAGSRHTCPKCALAGETVGGDRVPKDFYYSDAGNYRAYRNMLAQNSSFRLLGSSTHICSYCRKDSKKHGFAAKQNSSFPLICIDCTKMFAHNFPGIAFSFPIGENAKTPHSYVIADSWDERTDFYKCGFCNCGISSKNPLYIMRKPDTTDTQICKNCLKAALAVSFKDQSA